MLRGGQSVPNSRPNGVMLALCWHFFGVWTPFFRRWPLLGLFLTIFWFSQNQFIYAQEIPHIEKVGNKHQLIVNNKPFLILGGELGNSTGTTIESMQPVWHRLEELHLNTVLIPVYWELLEPKEGKFDFQLVDDLIKEARAHNLKIVLLWFGAWKNSMSSHAPAWVKLDQKRFPRAKSASGGIG